MNSDQKKAGAQDEMVKTISADSETCRDAKNARRLTVSRVLFQVQRRDPMLQGLPDRTFVRLSKL